MAESWMKLSDCIQTSASMNLKGTLKGIVGREIFLENTLAECKHRDQASWKYVHKNCHMYYWIYITSNEHKFLKVNAFIF